MKTRMTVIVDNTPFEELKGEWGLSIYIEYGNKKILLDAGGSQLFAENMAKLGCDIKDVDYAVLSHAHYDHSGGMARFFRENGKAKFFVRKATAPNCYKKAKIFRVYIGIPKNILTEFPDRIESVSGNYKLCEGAYLIAHKAANLGIIGKREKMYQKTAAGWKPDDFSHEQSLVLETDKGLVIFSSCSHGGVANIVREVSEAFAGKEIYGIVGGLHLYNKTDEEVRKVASDIRECGIKYICTGHCTKDRAYDILDKELNGIDKLRVGLVREF